jgi:hypothetical protein
MIAASSRSGGLIGTAGPYRTKLTGEGLRLGVAGARKCVNVAALPARHLRNDVRCGAETVETEPARLTGHAQRTVADQPGTEQRCHFRVGVAGRDREAEALIRHGVVAVAAIDLIAGEARLCA